MRNKEPIHHEDAEGREEGRVRMIVGGTARFNESDQSDESLSHYEYYSRYKYTHERAPSSIRDG